MDIPTRTTETITLTYWKCGRHCKVHHQTKEAALRCTSRMSARSKAEISAKASARGEKAWKLKQNGLSYKEIGVHLGLSASRARQVAQHGRKIEERHKLLRSKDTKP